MKKNSTNLLNMGFTPIFHPGTIPYVEDENGNETPLDMINPNELSITTIIRFRQPKNLATPDIDHKQYLNATDELIQEYRLVDREHFRTTDYRNFVKYCEKYGAPFPDLPIKDLGLALNQLYAFTWHNEFIEKINESCNAYATTLADYFKENPVKTAKMRLFSLGKKFKFFIPGPTPTEDYPFPLFQILIDRADLPIIEAGSTAQRQALFREKLYDNLVQMFNTYPPQYKVKMIENTPTIEISSENRLLFYLLTHLMPPGNLYYCKRPGCNKMIHDDPSGKKKEFCCTECKDKYYWSTDIGKLKNLLRGWKNRNKKVNLPHVQYDHVLGIGETLLERGKTYKEVQHLLEKYVKDGVFDGRIN